MGWGWQGERGHGAPKVREAGGGVWQVHDPACCEAAGAGIPATVSRDSCTSLRLPAIRRVRSTHATRRSSRKAPGVPVAWSQQATTQRENQGRFRPLSSGGVCLRSFVYLSFLAIAEEYLLPLGHAAESIPSPSTCQLLCQDEYNTLCHKHNPQKESYA